MSSTTSRPPGSAARDHARRKLLALVARLSPLALAAWVAVTTGGGFPG